jgi:hypothetical protein
MITAKVIVSTKLEQGEGEDRQVAVTFRPDYDDDRNKEWSRYTPALSLSMTLKGTVADKFEVDNRYTLSFEPEA